MTAFDFAVIGILSISVLVGVLRGFVYEVMSLAGWPVAFLLSRFAGPKIAPLLPLADAEFGLIVSYVLVFVVTLLIWAVVVWLVSALFKVVLGWMDSMMGAVFGLLRGVVLLLVAVWAAGMTNIPSMYFWRDARFSHRVEDVALMTKHWLPNDIARRIHYRERV